MIFDHLKNLKRYNFPKSDLILGFIANNNCLTLPNGQMEIDGENLFVKVMEYQPKLSAENKFEAHRVHADLQFMVSGIELMQTVFDDEIKSITDYDEGKDIQFFTAQKNITELIVSQGEFAVFFPGEIHKPSSQYLAHPSRVKKLVFKVKIN